MAASPFVFEEEMPTLSTIEQRVQDNVIFLPTQTSGKIRGWIQEAQERLEERYAWRAMHATQTFITTEDQRQLGLKSAMTRFLRTYGLPYQFTGLGGTSELEFLDTRDQATRQYSEFDALSRGGPRAILENDLNFDVYPFPDDNSLSGDLFSDGDYRVVIPYLQRLVTLDDSNTNNFFSDSCSEYLEHWASFRAMSFNEDNDRANVAIGLAQANLKRYLRRERKQYASTIQIRPRTDYYASRNAGRLNAVRHRFRRAWGQ